MSLSLHLDSASFAFSSAVPVLDGVTLHLYPGWTGVVGANGAGKTTLLRLMAGQLQPQQGALRLEPPDALVHLCPQRVESLTDAIEDFAWAWDADAQRIKARLELDPAEVMRWETLSPGERKRWQVGAALARRVDVLLLDEPTNHLDRRGQRLLLDALEGFSGVGALVCHNASFLRALTTSTLRVRDGRATLYEGHVAQARRTWEAEAAEEARRYERLSRERRKLERRLTDQRRARASAERNVSHRSRMTSIKDHDARSMARKNKAMAAESRLGRSVGQLRDAHARVSEELSSFSFDKRLGRSLFVDYEPSPASRLATLVGLDVEIGGEVLLEDVRVWLERDDRVRLSGPNGSGKTTLLRALLDEAALPPERVLYVPQEVPQEAAAARLEEALALPPGERGHVMQLVAALGVDPERLMVTRSPSPGEARKLEIAWGLARQVWLLVLDEPTNHLDLPSVERLEAALRAYPGALVLVSHDDDFAGRCTEVGWEIEEGRVRRA